MSVFRYPKYKIRIDPDSDKTQGLQTGDIVHRQYAGRERSVYSLMAVLETGVETVGNREAPYFVGALLDGDEPQNGELLDFVRITNLFDSTRSGALYLTASDSEAPYMGMSASSFEARTLNDTSSRSGCPTLSSRVCFNPNGVPSDDGTVRVSRTMREASASAAR